MVVKGYWDSIDPLSGTIDYGENKFIKLKISNHSTTDANLTLTTVLGYENGGDLPSTSSTLVTDVVNEYNYMMYYTSSHSATYYFLNSELKNDQIQSIVFTGDNIVPDGYTSKDVSKDSDGTVVMWYGETNDDGLYDVYIGSGNGITSFYSGYYLFGRLTYLEYIDFTRSDTSKVTNMYRMFSETGYSASEFSLDLSNFNTSNVIDMSYMFDRVLVT